MSLVKFFVYEDWLILMDLIDPIDITIIDDRDSLIKHVKESYSGFMNKIIATDNIHPLVVFYFANCSTLDGIKTLLILLLMI